LELSAKKRSESEGAEDSDRSRKSPAAHGNRRQRSSDLGRALRSVYDDTLRESVPDDLVNLLGKLR
jgi:hypothetical protein